jgi:O-antigen ligase
MIFIFFPIVLLPFYFIKIQTGFGPLMLLDAATGLSFVCWVIYKKIGHQRIHNPFSNNRLLGAGVLLFALGIVLGILQSDTIIPALGRVKSWFVAPLLFYIMLYDLCVERGEQMKQKVLLLYAGVTGLTACVALLAHFVTYDARLMLFGNPNYLAFFVAPACIISCWGFFSSKNSGQRRYYLILCGILFATLFFTFSYSAWFGTIIAVGYIMRSFFSRKTRRMVMWAAAVVTLLLLLLSLEKFLNLFQDRSSLLARWEIWKAAVVIFYTAHGLGIGFGGFQEAYLTVQRMFPPYLHWAVLHAHSTFLQLLVETGVIGFLGFFVIVWSFITTKAPPLVRLLVNGYIIYFFCNSLFDTLYFKNDLALVFWLFMAL